MDLSPSSAAVKPFVARALGKARGFKDFTEISLPGTPISGEWVVIMFGRTQLSLIREAAGFRPLHTAVT